MPKPEIIGSAQSTYTRVVRMVCEEKGIAYALTETPLRAPEVLAIHPFGKMPVLRHGDVALCESKAIATYLDRSFPRPACFPVRSSGRSAAPRNAGLGRISVPAKRGRRLSSSSLPGLTRQPMLSRTSAWTTGS